MQMGEQLLQAYNLGIKKADFKVIKYRLKRSVELEAIQREDLELKAA